MAAVRQPAWEERLKAGLEEGSRFFVGQGDVNHAARAIAQHLESARIPYAIAGAMALNAHGYRRFTEDVDVLLTHEGLLEFKKRFLGRGYVERFPGSRGMRDTEHGVKIDVLVAGDFPGDGKPKPVVFPDPQVVAIQGTEFRVLPLATLVELKLASGMSALHRAKDIGDVVELIRAVSLPRALALELDVSVREKYVELWAAVQAAPPED
ncbi:MAG: hypothetical protein EXR75_03210 [Myxococcales bacterium]|nr:hypothetical protein [Myxococcales bacterium]